MKLPKTILILCCLTSLNVVSQNDATNRNTDIALQYMKAYSAWDVAKMKTFYSDSIQFKDPTAVETFNSNYDAIGKEKVAAIFKGVFPDALPEYVSFNVKEHFKSGSFVVINSTFQLILPKSWNGDTASEKIFVSVPMVTILRFKNQKIISHKDYVDYDSYKQQISLQLKTKKTKQ